jgi:hypothetical protein
MSAAKRPRSGTCTRADARVRLAAARKYYEAAELLQGEAREGVEESGSVAATMAILSGIAATDVACCVRLGLRPRDDHNRAKEFLESMTDGDKAAKSLAQLISLKDTASYGLINITVKDLDVAMRQAKYLLDFAESVFN